MEEIARAIKGFRKELKAVKEAIEDIQGMTDEGLTAKQTKDMRRVVDHYHISPSTSLIPVTVTYPSHRHLYISPPLTPLTVTIPLTFTYFPPHTLHHLLHSHSPAAPPVCHAFSRHRHPIADENTDLSCLQAVYGGVIFITPASSFSKFPLTVIISVEISVNSAHSVL